LESLLVSRLEIIASGHCRLDRDTGFTPAEEYFLKQPIGAFLHRDI
jgi:hypothetical protein